MRRILTGLVVIASSSFLASCGPNGGNTDGGTDGGQSNPLACGTDHADVTAQKVFDEVINTTSSACASCHFAGNPDGTGGTLDLSTVDKLKATVGMGTIDYGSAAKVVEANKSENSTLYLKVIQGTPKTPDGKTTGQRMPSGSSGLPEAQQKIIKDWICTGAK